MPTTMSALPAGRLLDYAQDGTEITLTWTTTGNPAVFSDAEKANLLSLDRGSYKDGNSNDEDDSHYLYLIFPADRTISGFYYDPYHATTNVMNYYFATSTNTTGPGTGTWNDQETWNHGGPANVAVDTASLRTNPFLRSFLTPIVCRGIRIRHYFASTSHTVPRYRSLLLWTTDLPDGLHFWHPTLDQAAEASEMDFSDPDTYALDADRTADFRVKNTSTVLTANNITVQTGISSIGDLDTEMSFSDGGAYGSSVSIASLAPGAISGVITMKRPSPLLYTPNTARGTLVRADASSWT